MNRKKQGKETHTTPYPIRSRPTEKDNNSDISDHDEEEISDDSIDDSRLDSLDPGQLMVIEIMKDMIGKLEINITTKLDRTVSEIKVDVSQIKSHMEKYNEKMEEVQGRISNTEDKVEKMSEVIEEIYDFKAEWEKTLTEIDKDACRLRKNNIIFKGLKSWSKDTSVALKNFEKVRIEELKLS